MRRRSLVALGCLLAVAGALVGIRLASAASVTVSNKGTNALRACVLTGVTNNGAVTDTHVNENAKTTNYGSNAIINTASQKNINRIGFVRFDLTKCNPAIPTTAAITTARLRLWATAVQNRNIDVRRVTGAWTETGMTWSNQPAVAATLTASTKVATTGTWWEWDVTSDIPGFLADAATNRGWQLKDSVPDATTDLQTNFHSSEAGAATAQRPQLVIVYR